MHDFALKVPSVYAHQSTPFRAQMALHADCVSRLCVMREGIAESHGGMPAAGASQHAAVEESSTKVAHEMFRLNVLGPISLTRAALPFLLSRRKGKLMVVSSMAAMVPAPGQAVCFGTELALRGYFATMQSELNDRQATYSSLQVVLPRVLENVRLCREHWKV